MTARRIVATYMTLAGTYTLAASLIWSVNTLFLLDAGLALGAVFLANALFSAGMVVFEIPTGVVADTLGRRASYLLSASVLASTTVLYLLAAQASAGLAAFGAISIAMGLGFTFYSGALEAWLVDGLRFVGEDDALDHVFARSQQVTGAAMFLGTIAGGFLGQIDLALPYILRAVLLLTVLLLASRLMHDIGFTPTSLRVRQLPARMRQQAADGITYGWCRRDLRLLMTSSAISAVFFGWAYYAAQPYFLELLERDAVWVVGLVTAAVSLATIVGNQIVDVIGRRCTRRTTMLLGAATASTIASIVIGTTSTFAVAVASLLVVAAAIGVTTPVRQAYLHEVTSTDVRATVVSFDAMVASVGGVGGQVGLGAVSDARSLSSGYIVGGAITGLALPVLWMLRAVGGTADRLRGREHAGVEGTCVQGLPRFTGVEAIAAGATVDG